VNARGERERERERANERTSEQWAGDAEGVDEARGAGAV